MVFWEREKMNKDPWKKGASSGFLSEGKGPFSPSEEDKKEGIVRRRRWHGPLWQEWPLQPANYTKINYIASHWTRGPLHLKKGTLRTVLWNRVLASYINGKSKANNVYLTNISKQKWLFDSTYLASVALEKNLTLLFLIVLSLYTADMYQVFYLLIYGTKTTFYRKSVP